MIDPQSPVLLPGAGLVIPERVLAGRIVDRAQRVGEAKAQQRLKTFAGGWAKQRVLGPGRRIMDVLGPWDDVEVASQHQRLLGLEPLLRILKKPGHPSELVGVFVRAYRVAVGQIETGDAQ